ncbi:MAG: polyphosphate kinase 1 [Acidimicrobiales bacterium]
MEHHDDIDLSSRFTNRELSWLNFNARVLARAEDESVPELERLKFCAIYASNLDEFFMVRVAGLKDQVAAGITRTPPDGYTPLAQLRHIKRTADRQLDRLERIHVDALRVALAAKGIEIIDWADLDDDERAFAAVEFETRIFPILTPLAVDPGHPFPYISNLSLNLAVQVFDPSSGRQRFARIKVPPSIDRFLALPSGRFVSLEQVIAAHVDQLFPGFNVTGAWPFRVTRNADISLEDEGAEDLLEAVELELRRRRFGRAIRLQVDHTMPPEIMKLLLRELDLEGDDVYHYRGLIDCTGYWQLVSLDRPELLIDSYSGVVPRELQDIESPAEFFARIRRGDILLHHPYDSFSASVSEFVRSAANDPMVRAIKLTIYRTSGDSPIVQSLIHAAEQGKQVAVLVEVKARFDEQANIEWARRLEEAGVHVAYGLVGLKIHCKTALVVREEHDGLRRYCHIGTGNYNPKTATIYEDLGLLTADLQIGEDLSQLFNFLTGYGNHVAFENLLVAPYSLRTGVARLIENERMAPAGEGRIVLKLNSLVDADLIEALYAASQAGVSIDLIVRGICCLRPGIPGLSENIRVRSVVGRYLEHSRILYFANGRGPGTPSYYIGSADLMPRNLDRRVEALVRIDDPAGQARLDQVIEYVLADDDLAWTLGPDDEYHPITTGTFQAHDAFEVLARQRAGVDRSIDITTEMPRPVVRRRPQLPDKNEETMSEIAVRAAGCVVWRRIDGKRRFAVVHRPRYDDWSFAKGKLDPGETELQAALREVLEETGLEGQVGPALPTVFYVDHKDRPKSVHYWLLEHDKGTFVENDEVDELRWCTAPEAADLLTYEYDRTLLEQAAELLGD